jgi:hypothetical protein
MSENGLPIWLRQLKGRPGRSEMDRIGQPGGPSQRPGAIPGGIPALPVTPQGPQPNDFRLALDQFTQLLAAIWRQSEVFMLPFSAQILPVRIRPAENRKYMFIQNQSGAAQLALGINQPPGPFGTNPVAGLVIPANFGFYEPLVIPQGEIWVSASAANTPAILLYSA